MLKGDDGYISIDQAVTFSGLSKSTIRRLEIAGAFPRRKKLSARRRGYLRSELEEWALQLESN